MTTVAEIKSAIARLPEPDKAKVYSWVLESVETGEAASKNNARIQSKLDEVDTAKFRPADPKDIERILASLG